MGTPSFSGAFSFEDLSFLGNAVFFGKQFPASRRTLVPSSSGSSTVLLLFDPEDEGTKTLRKVGNCLKKGSIYLTNFSCTKN
jgi:hypothetical protein